MYDIQTLAKRTKLKTRQLRYVLDQSIIPDLTIQYTGLRRTRTLRHFDAFAVLVVTSLLEAGLNKDRVVKIAVGMNGAALTLRPVSLYSFYCKNIKHLSITEDNSVFARGRWYSLATGKPIANLQPCVEIRVSLQRLRRLLNRGG